MFKRKVRIQVKGRRRATCQFETWCTCACSQHSRGQIDTSECRLCSSKACKGESGPYLSLRHPERMKNGQDLETRQNPTQFKTRCTCALGFPSMALKLESPVVSVNFTGGKQFLICVLIKQGNGRRQNNRAVKGLAVEPLLVVYIFKQSFTSFTSFTSFKQSFTSSLYRQKPSFTDSLLQLGVQVTVREIQIFIKYELDRQICGKLATNQIFSIQLK